jgi:hypothetical protein
MNIPNVGDLSLGQWSAIVRAWNKSHNGNKPIAPTDDEFDLAVMRARGVA